MLADGGAAHRKGIAGVHPGAGVGGEESAVVGGLSRLGIDLDLTAAKGRIAVLGGEQIGVDLDVGDGRFGRERSIVVAALKTVDGEGGAGGVAAGGCGHLLKLAEKVVRVVGE